MVLLPGTNVTGAFERSREAAPQRRLRALCGRIGLPTGKEGTRGSLVPHHSGTIAFYYPVFRFGGGYNSASIANLAEIRRRFSPRFTFPITSFAPLLLHLVCRGVRGNVPAARVAAVLWNPFYGRPPMAFDAVPDSGFGHDISLKRRVPGVTRLKWRDTAKAIFDKYAFHIVINCAIKSSILFTLVVGDYNFVICHLWPSWLLSSVI